VLEVSTDKQGNPILLHLLRLDVPALIATKELHLSANQLSKSLPRPFKMKTMAKLSWFSLEAEGWQTKWFKAC